MRWPLHGSDRRRSPTAPASGGSRIKARAGHAALLAVLPWFLSLLMGCGLEPPMAAPTGSAHDGIDARRETPDSPAPTSEAVGASGRAPAIPLVAADVPGTLTLATTRDEGGVDVWAVDPATGETRFQWATEPGWSVSEWRVSPDGSMVLYRVSHPLKEVREALRARPLVEAAEAVTVTQTRDGEGRLSGAVWDGGHVVFGLAEEVPLPRPAGAEPERTSYALGGWALWRASPGDRPAHVADAGAQWTQGRIWTLRGWSAPAGVAAVTDAPEYGGPIQRLMFVDAGGLVGELPLEGALPGDLAEAPGRLAATTQADAVDVYDVARTGATHFATGEGLEAETPVWSDGGAHVGWVERPPSAIGPMKAGDSSAIGRLRVVHWGEASSSHTEDVVPVPGLQKLWSLDPAGSVALAAVDDELVAVRLSDGAQRAVRPVRVDGGPDLARLWHAHWGASSD